MGIVYIMRGLPYTGKSKRAHELAGSIGRIHSTNDFFVKGGVFNFNPSLLEVYHKKNQRNFVKSLKDRFPTVVCDNCNTKKWEFEFYLKMAVCFGYDFKVVTMQHISEATFNASNWRNIPLHKFRAMRTRFESFTPSSISISIPDD